MNRKSSQYLDFEIDRLTNSIQNVITGDSFETDVLSVTKDDMNIISRKNGWLFDWKSEYKLPEREVYKLTIINNLTVVQGLISLEVKTDHIFLHLIENAPFNKGRTKVYEGVAGNLVAFACRLSFRRGFEGFVSFLSKSQLIDHYRERLGANHVGGRLMIIETIPALKLVNQYFKN